MARPMSSGSSPVLSSSSLSMNGDPTLSSSVAAAAIRTGRSLLDHLSVSFSATVHPLVMAVGER